MRIAELLSVLLIASPAAALAADGLDVKLGLWEISYTTEIHGSMIPKSVLDKMPPAQRAKIEAQMQQRAAARPKEHTSKSCVTAKDIKEGAFRAGEDKVDKSCKTTVITQSHSVQEATVSCGGEQPRTSHMKIQTQGRDHMTGRIDSTVESGQVTVQLSGKWLGESCAGADGD